MVFSEREYEALPTMASAFSNPSEAPSGGITLKVTVTSSCSLPRSNGISSGVYFQPSGRFSFTFPITDDDCCDRTLTPSSFGCSSPKIHTPFDIVRSTAGTTSTGLCCSPFTGSVHWYSNGSSTTKGSPATVKVAVKVIAGGLSGLPISEGWLTVNIPLLWGSLNQ